MIIPTLAADPVLMECLDSLERQTTSGFQVVVVDNSGKKAVRRMAAGRNITIVEPGRNLGFGPAVNLAIRQTTSTFVATLNDDAVAHSGWVEALAGAMKRHPDAGMCASQVRLAGNGRLDSAGMLLCADGSSKQRGHLCNPAGFHCEREVLLPSGSAAMYRRAMLDETGLFDDRFFLYCEDTDLGLRGCWAGWKCLYVPEAIVEHRYSHSTGRASPLKAYYVERNRLFVAVKNFPAAMLWKAPFVSTLRYLWHLVYMFRGRGAGAEFRGGHSALLLPWYVLRAHMALLGSLPDLWRERRRIRTRARISSSEFGRLAAMHRISARQVAQL
ncbi:MAG: glycosyltransferase family 2 protein [Bryobacterales bacterium]|nr:glycosyltransferase family 2 protein [Bryobacterales bacterium]